MKTFQANYSTIKIITASLLLQFAFQISSAQSFTKITTGDVVNTPGDYRSVNWIDYDNDGYLDLQITNGNAAGDNNTLYHNNGNGTFTTVLTDPIVSDNQPSDGATWADFDNDGDVDCFVVNWYGINNMFYINNGNGTFTQDMTSVIATDSGYSETASWGDYDNDGYVDLYVTNSDSVLRNYLYHNNGNGTFTKITSGNPVTDQRISRCVNWTDYDSDGDADIFVSNEGNQNENLYVNDSTGNFTSITTGVLVTAGGKTMSSSWGDYDNDGDQDVVLANDQGNEAFFRNDGAGVFTKLITDTLVKCGGNSFGSNWGDIDNDGDLDLIITNSFWGGMWHNFLFINNGNGTFSRDAATPIVQDSGWSYGCAFGDYDNDGFLDLAVANCYNASQNNSLYHNDGNSNHWIEIKCIGVISNRSAIGAKIKIKANINGIDVWQFREISAQTGYCGQNMLTVHVGLGNASNIDTLKIEWPSGIVDMYLNVNTDQITTAIEGQSLNAIDDIKTPDVTLLTNHPNPFIDDTAFEFELNDNSYVQLFIYDSKGYKIATLLNKKMSKGKHTIKWNGNDNEGKKISAGVFLYVLRNNDQLITRKLTHLK
ncbi:MAG: CRTAC1 family protein [Bacteroidia bacterium]